MPSASPFAVALEELRTAAGAYPEAYEEQPWGELAVKVRKKMFVVLMAGETLVISVKLPESQPEAVKLPFCEPAGYGMGKHGWVTARISDPDDLDLPTMLGWIEESYRAVAPKRLSKSVPLGGPVPGAEIPMPEVPADAPEVVVVSDDPLRADRAIRGLAAEGVRGLRATTADLDALADAEAAAILVDLGRSAVIAFELAGQLAMLHFDCPLVLAGIRDRRSEDAAREQIPGAAVFHRDPPGDPAVVAATVALLRG